MTLRGKRQACRYLRHAVAALLLALLVSCGGGGSGGPAPAPTTVSLKLSTVARAGENPQIKGVTLTLLLPDGVTLKTAGSTRQTADGVVRYSGAAAFSNLTSQLFPRPLFGNFSAARPAGRGAVRVSIIGLAGFAPGEFATVACDVAGGTTVTEQGFQVVEFQVIGDSATQLSADLTDKFAAPKLEITR